MASVGSALTFATAHPEIEDHKTDITFGGPDIDMYTAVCMLSEHPHFSFEGPAGAVTAGTRIMLSIIRYA